METKRQFGTLVVTERSAKTTYPVFKAEFGTLKYTDTTEIWFSVVAGTAASNPHEDPREPRMSATFYDPSLDPADLSNVTFEIVAPNERPKWPPAEAQFYYFAHPGMPADFSSGRIRFQQAVGNSYLVNWTATLDSYNSRPKPGSQIEVELNATFQQESVIVVPGSLKDADFNNPGPSYGWLSFPVILIGMLMSVFFPDSRVLAGLWLLLFVGTFVGSVTVQILNDRKYQKIVRAIESQTRKQETSYHAEPDNSGEHE
ncbi:MAG: hypothetical protein JJ992_17540 [Planctomycetes bacterium]|nr:hypothetical protein [Planctomycetota bacterium]